MKAKEEFFFDRISLTSHESPVVGILFNEDDWCLITTHRLFVVKDGELQFVENSLIQNIEPIDFGKARKTDWKELKVQIKGELPISIITDSGLPYFGLWNMLRFIAQRNA